MATKPEKEQPEQLPSPKQKVLGVIVNAQAEALTIEICPKRREKMMCELNRIWETNYLSPDEAQQVAGKLGFMATTLCGGLGMAAIQPFYSRAHGLGEHTNIKLTFGLRAAINTLRQLLQDSRPRTLPWSSPDTMTQAVIYSDAFFRMGRN